MTYSHKDLCSIAVNWLRRPASRNGPGCNIAFSEVRSDWTGECPDAIGFRAGVCDEASIVIEVKTSRSDFLADRKKPHRMHPEKGMGIYRYFLAPEGLLSVDELPLGWGLLEVNSRGAIKVKSGHALAKRDTIDSWKHTRAINAEWVLLIRLLNRVGDGEKVKNWLKEAAKTNTRIIAENERLRKTNDSVLRENLQIKRRLHLLEKESILNHSEPVHGLENG